MINLNYTFTKKNIIRALSVAGLSALATLTGQAGISTILYDLGDANNSTRYGETVTETDNAGYTGSGFLAFNNRDDSGFTVEAPYEFKSLTLRYAANSTNPGEFYVYIDGTDSLEFSGNTIVFPKTGAWSTWTDVTLDLSGNSGDYFNLAWDDTFTNDGGANFDSIEFTPVPEPTAYPILFGIVATLFAGCIRRRR